MKDHGNHPLWYFGPSGQRLQYIQHFLARHPICLLLFILGTLLSAYLGWAQHRVSNTFMQWDATWPETFPLPDFWLIKLEAWYDAQNPVPPGTLKLHGELARVQSTVLIAQGVSLLILLAGLLPIAWHWTHRPIGHCEQCGYDLRHNTNPTTCPECGAKQITTE